ncbi:uncharacterized protein CC84DRAFT_1242899 [Paraphaeosphaeria sporulosa]|uniref:Uncharacterized protein n=1 Tax=Paraphaeosphaeria sporulosa TaxID=1460663 RepID=A0A177CIR0_9PLEO|nr:uncharacterized protein CC84DRAFT_1242899 [Paraphaeosphaeria sporulosa]OAG07393.1 hypothetical protein CC84DRAFT_1242899 [Paraphaeosphaeria sporulosa]
MQPMTSHQLAVASSKISMMVPLDCVDGNSRASARRPCFDDLEIRPSAVESLSLQKHILKRVTGDIVLTPPQSASNYSSAVSDSPFVIEAQDFIRRQIGSGPNMPPERLAVLVSTMSVVDYLLYGTKFDVYYSFYCSGCQRYGRHKISSD